MLKKARKIDIIYVYEFLERVNSMKKNKEKKEKKNKKKVNHAQAKYDRGQVFVKIIAAFLAFMMIVAVATSTLYVVFG